MDGKFRVKNDVEKSYDLNVMDTRATGSMHSFILRAPTAAVDVDLMECRAG